MAKGALETAGRGLYSGASKLWPSVFEEPKTYGLQGGGEKPTGNLFSGGGANQIVNPATPAPGTQFQGPITAAAGFAGQPNAPTPPPSTTPPALPPVKRPTPDEERQRMLANQ